MDYRVGVPCGKLLCAHTQSQASYGSSTVQCACLYVCYMYAYGWLPFPSVPLWCGIVLCTPDTQFNTCEQQQHADTACMCCVCVCLCMCESVYESVCVLMVPLFDKLTMNDDVKRHKKTYGTSADNGWFTISHTKICMHCSNLVQTRNSQCIHMHI